MKHQFIAQNSSPVLTLLFAGWGMSAADFGFFKTSGSDFLVCSDYRTFDFDIDIISAYPQIRLIGYSLGVWAASFVLRDKQIAFSRKTAINGTQFPADDQRGIPVKIFDGTQGSLSDSSLMKFYRRMCGTKDGYQEFITTSGNKDIARMSEELCAIRRASANNEVAQFRWDEAYISSGDAIFPPANQYAAWQGNARIIETDGAHFDRNIFEKISRSINE